MLSGGLASVGIDARVKDGVPEELLSVIDPDLWRRVDFVGD